MKLSEDLLTDVLDELNEIVYIQDVNWRVLYANKMALEVFGYRKDEAEGLDLRKLLDGKSLRLATERLEEMLKSKKPPQKPAEYQVKTKDGRKIWVELRTKPIVRDGEVVAILGIARDITERKLLEEKLKESEEKLRVIFENSPNIIVVVMRREGLLRQIRHATGVLGRIRLERTYMSCFRRMLPRGG